MCSMVESPGTRNRTRRVIYGWAFPMLPEFTVRTEFPRAAHPGVVIFVGPDGSERTELADHIPDWLKFAPGADGAPIPVVRVVRLQSESGYSLRSYGADGRLLWVGLMVPPAPSAISEQSEELPTVPRVAPSHQVSTPRFSSSSRPALAAQTTGWF